MTRVWPQAKSGKKRRRSYHLRVELLEDRLVPATLDFVPIAEVSVNPQPLPPGDLVEFDPLLQVPPIPAIAQSISSPIHVQGHFTESGELINPAAAGAAVSWSLEVFYVLAGHASENVFPQGPAGAPSTVNASYNMAGQVVAALTVQGPAGKQQTLQIDGITVQGSLDGTVAPPDPITHKHLGRIKWENITLSRGSASSPSFGSWLHQTRSDSSGTFAETEQPATVGGTPVSLTAPFSQQDRITSCLMPVSPNGHPPQPCYQIDGVYDAAGSVTENFVTTGPPVVLAGAVDYQADDSGTITLPPAAAEGGTTVPLLQTSMNKEKYLTIEFEPGQ